MRSALVFALLLLVSVPLLAQDYPRKVEVFGGYMFTRVTNDVYSGHANWSGWNAAGSYFFRRSIGITLDVGGMYKGGTVVGTSTQSRSHSFLIGPSWKLRSGKINPFTHALVGFERDSVAAPSGSGLGSPATNRFALALGGGLDVPLNHVISLRVFQLDYALWHTKYLGNNHNLRLATGILFRFGH